MVLFPFYVCMWAREMTDTLESKDGDRIIVTYEIVRDKNQFEIKFNSVQKALGQIYKEKYRKLDEVVVLFFDKIGNYEDNTKFSGIGIDAFGIPKEISYEVTADGYFLLNANSKPTIPVNLVSGESAELSIPMFLAHYEGKQRYNVFSRCENLVIKLPEKKSINPSDDVAIQKVSQTVTTQEELEGESSEVVEACTLINIVFELLDKQEGGGFSDELQQHISRLRFLRFSTANQELSSKIDEVLDDCTKKENELKAEARAAEKAESQRVADIQRQETARRDSIAAAAQQQAEKDSKRNLWLIIGGVIFAILAFVGNQMFQHFRNVKNQKSIMDMQQNVVKRAEDEAKRRARNMAQSQVNRVQGEARSKTRSAINDGINKVGQKGKGNKRISI